MSSPGSDIALTVSGYDPLTVDAEQLIGGGRISEVLVLGDDVPDIIDDVDDLRMVPQPEVSLPEGVYWFTGVTPSAAMIVSVGTRAHEPVATTDSEPGPGTPLGAALGWLEHLWEGAQPLERPAFKVGEGVIVATSGEDATVRGREVIMGRWQYTVSVAGSQRTVSERAIAAREVSDDPLAWVTGDPSDARRFAATLTRAKLEDHFTDTVFSFRATKTLFRPYQFKPVLKLLNSGSMRMLIADEVGLGKTIEAGLAWTELEARMRADRVLVVCPSSLVTKWQREMDERFGFELIEFGPKLRVDTLERLETGKSRPRVAYIASIESLRKWDGLERASQLGLNFDLVIVDEAHAFRNSETKSHQLGQAISQWADALLFLSATPVNLRSGDLYNLLELLVPGEFDDVHSLERRIAPNATLHRITSSLLDPNVTNKERLGWLETLAADPFGNVLLHRPATKLLRELLRGPHLAPRDVARVKRLCSELHGLAAEITRTRKVEVRDDKAVRSPRVVEVEWTDAERDFYGAFFDWCKVRAQVSGQPMNFSMQMPLRLAGSCLPAAARDVLDWRSSFTGDASRSESAMVPPSRALIELASRLGSDTKYEQFEPVVLDLVEQKRQMLVFTFSRKTLDYLHTRLLHAGVRVATLHGDVPKDERHRVMEGFRAGEFDVVLATKVASEGLDFEFCSVVVNYDLPWNPMEVEQRIGRIDRVGQRESKIVILNFHTPGTIETDIIERVMARIGVFEQAIGELEPIIEAAWRGFESQLLDFDLTEEQRAQKSREVIAAIEEQKLALQDVETAAPYLISSDGMDIEGLEADLVAAGRYVGQRELAILVRDWVEAYGGRVTERAPLLTVEGNAELASHVTRLVSSRIRTGSEVEATASNLRNAISVTVTLDQEHARTTGTTLLTATHPLVLAAQKMPGHRQARLGAIRLDPDEAGVPAGAYLCLLSVARWDGVRPLHEVWSAAVDLAGLRPASQALGDAVMAGVAAGSLSSARIGSGFRLDTAVRVAVREIARRRIVREEQLLEENGAIAATREESLREGHERRRAKLNKQVQSLIAKGHERMLPAALGRLKREDEKYAKRSADLDQSTAATLGTSDLVVCLVEVTG
nr:helicase-related protein [Ornithinimicrobium sp. HY1793]